MKSKKSQIKIESEYLEDARKTVEKVFLAAAEKFNLHDNSETSRVPDTIRSIVEGKGFGFGMGGRVVAGAIYVDFFPNANDSVKFREVHDYILSELQTAFHVQFQETFEDHPEYRKTH